MTLFCVPIRAGWLASLSVATLAGCRVGVARRSPEALGLRQEPTLRTESRDQLPSHAAGNTELTADAFYGVPILQKSFFWDGNGEVDDSGIGVHVLHYLSDGVALGGGLNAASWWTGGRDVYSAELAGRLRIYAGGGLPLFAEGVAGFQLANDQIPPGGTVWNYSFGFGFGGELPVTEHTLLQSGVLYHHISNALGRQNLRNPSQNEARFWIGFCTEF